MTPIKKLLLAGAALPAALLLQQPAYSLDDMALDDMTPFVVAQGDSRPAGAQQPGQQQKPQQRPQPPQQRPQAPQQQQRSQPPQQRPAVQPQPQRQPAAQPRREERREERREQRQDQRQQRQDQRQEQRRDNVPGDQRRDQRQDLRQNQQQQRQDLQQRQREEREKLKQQRDQRQQPRPDQNRGQTPGRPGAPNVQQQPQQRPGVPPALPAPQGDQRQAPSSGQPNPVEQRARRLDDIRGERREIREGNRRVIQEGSRSIVQDGNRKFIRHDENERFRRVGRDVDVQRVGSETRTVVVGPNGQRFVTVTDANGRLLRRSRFVNNREVVIIDNRPRGGRAATAFFVALPAIALATLAIPRERYIMEAESAPPEYIYGALMAPPIEPLPRAYTLDEIRYSPELRDRMPRIDLDTVTFDTGSWEIAPDQYNRLAPIADGIKRAIAQNPNEVFLIEGHTDAVGNDDDNLSLSDRRAEAVSVVLTDNFQIPPENLTTQGYGEQQLKIPNPGPERVNRRVTVRRITPLLQQGADLGGANPVPPDQIPEEQRQFAPPGRDERAAPPRRQNAPAQQQFAPR